MYSNLFYENVHLNVFYDFSKLTSPKESRCDVHNGTTQGHDYLKPIILHVKFSVEGKNIGYR
jgi:hypothetical protein